ncbi:MAG: RNA 2',3'-cyclic phosphodiesterase [Hyphomicrobiaceae bacterium]
MPRLFAGIELPEDIQERLTDLEAPLPGVRWIEADNLHITLRFAGDVDKRQANDFVEMLAGIDVPAFEVTISGLGTFGGKEPRALWAGIERCDQLDSLQRATERAARAAGLPPETRGFRPHITLARFNHPRIEALARYLERHGGFRLPPFFVGRFVLFSSRPNIGGGPYVVEEAFPLSGAAWDSDDERDMDPGGAQW